MTKFELEQMVFKYYKLVCELDNLEREDTNSLGLSPLPEHNNIRYKLHTLKQELENFDKKKDEEDEMINGLIDRVYRHVK